MKSDAWEPDQTSLAESPALLARRRRSLLRVLLSGKEVPEPPSHVAVDLPYDHEVQGL